MSSKTFKVNVSHEHKFYNWCNEPTLHEVARFFNDKLADIPDPYKTTARCYITQNYDDDNDPYIDPYISVKIAYARPETEQETKLRKDAEKLRAKVEKEKDLAELKRLKDK